MSTQNENLLVKLIKKSVGLPTGKSDCCGSSASSECCGSGASSDCCGAEASESSGCGCGNNDCGGDCCGAKNKEETESSPAVGSSAI